MTPDPIRRLVRLIGLLLLIACGVHVVASVFGMPFKHEDGGGFNSMISFMWPGTPLFEIDTARQSGNGFPFTIGINLSALITLALTAYTGHFFFHRTEVVMRVLDGK